MSKVIHSFFVYFHSWITGIHNEIQNPLICYWSTGSNQYSTQSVQVQCTATTTSLQNFLALKDITNLWVLLSHVKNTKEQLSQILLFYKTL